METSQEDSRSSKKLYSKRNATTAERKPVWQQKTCACTKIPRTSILIWRTSTSTSRRRSQTTKISQWAPLHQRTNRSKWKTKRPRPLQLWLRNQLPTKPAGTKHIPSRQTRGSPMWTPKRRKAQRRQNQWRRWRRGKRETKHGRNSSQQPAQPQHHHHQLWTQVWYRNFSGWEWKEQQCTAQSQHLSARQQHQQTLCAIHLPRPTSHCRNRSNHEASEGPLSRHTNMPTRGDANPKRSDICHTPYNQQKSYCRSKAATQTAYPKSPQPYSPTVLTRLPSSCVPADPKLWLGPQMGIYIVVCRPHPRRHHQDQPREMSETPKTKLTRAQIRQTLEEEVCKDERSVSSRISRKERSTMPRIERRQRRKHVWFVRNTLPSLSITALSPRCYGRGQQCQKRCWRWGGGYGQTARRRISRTKWNGRSLAVAGPTTQRTQRPASAYRSQPKYRKCQQPRDSNSLAGLRPSAGIYPTPKWSIPRWQVLHRQIGTGADIPQSSRTGCHRRMREGDAVETLRRQCKFHCGNRHRGTHSRCTKFCQRPERHRWHIINNVPDRQRWIRQCRRTGVNRPETVLLRYQPKGHRRRCRQRSSHRGPSLPYRSEGNPTPTPGTIQDPTSTPTQFSLRSRASHTARREKWSRPPIRQFVQRTQHWNRNSRFGPPSRRAAPPHGETGSRSTDSRPRRDNTSHRSQIPLSITLEPRPWRLREALRAAIEDKREHFTRSRHQHFKTRNQRATRGDQHLPSSSTLRMACRGCLLAIMATATRGESMASPKPKPIQRVVPRKERRGLPLLPMPMATRFASMASPSRNTRRGLPATASLPPASDGVSRKRPTSISARRQRPDRGPPRKLLIQHPNATTTGTRAPKPNFSKRWVRARTTADPRSSGGHSAHQRSLAQRPAPTRKEMQRGPVALPRIGQTPHHLSAVRNSAVRERLPPRRQPAPEPPSQNTSTAAAATRPGDIPFLTKIRCRGVQTRQSVVNTSIHPNLRFVLALLIAAVTPGRAVTQTTCMATLGIGVTAMTYVSNSAFAVGFNQAIGLVQAVLPGENKHLPPPTVPQPLQTT